MSERQIPSEATVSQFSLTSDAATNTGTPSTTIKPAGISSSQQQPDKSDPTLQSQRDAAALWTSTKVSARKGLTVGDQHRSWVNLRADDAHLLLQSRVEDLLLETLRGVRFPPKVVTLTWEELLKCTNPLACNIQLQWSEIASYENASGGEKRKIATFHKAIRANSVFLWERILRDSVQGAASKVSITRRDPEISRGAWLDAKHGHPRKCLKVTHFHQHVTASLVMIRRYIELTPGLTMPAIRFLREFFQAGLYKDQAPSAQDLACLPSSIRWLVGLIHRYRHCRRFGAEVFSDFPLLARMMFSLFAFMGTHVESTPSIHMKKATNIPSQGVIHSSRILRILPATADGATGSEKNSKEKAASCPPQSKKEVSRDNKKDENAVPKESVLPVKRPIDAVSSPEAAAAAKRVARELSPEEGEFPIETDCLSLRLDDGGSNESAWDLDSPSTPSAPAVSATLAAPAAPAARTAPFDPVNAIVSPKPVPTTTPQWSLPPRPIIVDSAVPDDVSNTASPTLCSIPPVASTTPTVRRRKPRNGKHKVRVDVLASSGHQKFLFGVQHFIFKNMQSLLERSLHAFFMEHRPMFLAKNGWTAPEALELHICLQKLREDPGLSHEKFERQSWTKLSHAIQEIRHIAVHRDTIPNEDLCKLISSASCFVDRCLSDCAATRLLDKLHLMTLGKHQAFCDETEILSQQWEADKAQICGQADLDLEGCSVEGLHGALKDLERRHREEVDDLQIVVSVELMGELQRLFKDPEIMMFANLI